MFDNDVEISSKSCSKCGSHTYWSQCHEIGCENGFIDMDEYGGDPLWYDEGDFEICPECHGRGAHNWCPACGWDLFENCYLNGKSELQPASIVE